jgi:hypothetical protein
MKVFVSGDSAYSGSSAGNGTARPAKPAVIRKHVGN